MPRQLRAFVSVSVPAKTAGINGAITKVTEIKFRLIMILAMGFENDWAFFIQAFFRRIITTVHCDPSGLMNS